MLTKPQLIDSIQQLNPSARAEWLGQFSAEDLREYLDHLQHGFEPRCGASAWQRRGTTAAAGQRHAA